MLSSEITETQSRKLQRWISKVSEILTEYYLAAIEVEYSLKSLFAINNGRLRPSDGERSVSVGEIGKIELRNVKVIQDAIDQVLLGCCGPYISSALVRRVGVNHVTPVIPPSYRACLTRSYVEHVISESFQRLNLTCQTFQVRKDHRLGYAYAS